MSTGTLYAVVLGGCAVAIVGAVVGMQFLSKPPPPPAPPPPPPPEKVTTQIRYSPDYFKANLDKDLETLRLPPMDVATLAKPLVYASELDAPRRMKAGGESFETPHLKVRTLIIKEWAKTESGQGFRYEHVTLELTNRSAVPIAYRVPTELTGTAKCKSKAALAHNGVVLKPGETTQRTECLFSPGIGLTIKAIEIVELTPLGLAYVSRIVPAQPLYDPRTYAGHTVGKEARPCQFIPWRDVDADLTKGATWGDVIDFYARHNCSEYSYVTGYRRWTTPGQLPARPAQ